MTKFNPNKPIQLSGSAHTQQPPTSGDLPRDPLAPFEVQYHRNLVPPEFVTPIDRAVGVSGQPQSAGISRRGFLGLAGAAVLVGAALAVAPEAIKRIEDATSLGERISAAEARKQAIEIAKSFIGTARPYFSEQLSDVAHAHSTEQSDADLSSIDKEAKNSEVMLEGIFGYNAYYDASSSIRLELYDPARPGVDGLPTAHLEVMFDDTTGAVDRNVSTNSCTFAELMNWTESATMPKDPTKVADPNDPNSALAMSRIGVLAVSDSKNNVPDWYAMEFTEDAVYVLKPGVGNQGYDENNVRNKDWLSPVDPEYTTAFKQTIAALTTNLQSFADQAKTAR